MTVLVMIQLCFAVAQTSIGIKQPSTGVGLVSQTSVCILGVCKNEI